MLGHLMSIFMVEGRRPLSGSIRVVGNKNEALPIIAASLLCPEPVALDNVSDIGDVRSMLEIASHLGARVERNGSESLTLTADTIKQTQLPLEAASRIRASMLFASSLLVRTGKASIPQPGGDAIGLRRIDTHFLVFEALGAKLRVERTGPTSSSSHIIYHLEAPKGLKGTEIYLDEASVTATENALIAAAGAKGTTRIANAASEPHVQGLCRFLQSMGVTIRGIGSNMLTITGTSRLKSTRHTIGSDYIEAGSFIGLAATTGSEISITNVDVRHLPMILMQFARIGVTVEADRRNNTIHVPARQTLRIKKDISGGIPKFDDSPWPGFPADLTSILLVTATQSEGTCLIHEKMFEARLFFVDKLSSMGAQIVLCDPHRAVVVGPSRLYGSKMSSPDIRAGMALLIAALSAEGTSVIQNIEQIDRGYQNIDQRLNALGARIVRQHERRKQS